MISEKEKERRRRINLVASQLARIINKPLGGNERELGMWTVQIFKKYPRWPLHSILEILDRCPIGYARGQVTGALRNEFLKTSDFSTMQDNYPAEVMEVLNIK